MRVRWTPQAADDLEAIFDYLSEQHPEYAKPTIAKIYNDVLALRQFPLLGRALSQKDLRALLIEGIPYVCIYRLQVDACHLLHIFHTAQDWIPVVRST